MSLYSQSSAFNLFLDDPPSSEHCYDSVCSSTGSLDSLKQPDVKATVRGCLKNIDFILWIKVHRPTVVQELFPTVPQTAQHPLRLSAQDSMMCHIPPHVDIPSVKEVNVMMQPTYIWKTVKVHQVPLIIPSFTQTMLIKFPTTLNCINFTKELRMLNEKLGVVGVSTWDVIDMLEPVVTTLPS